MYNNCTLCKEIPTFCFNLSTLFPSLFEIAFDSKLIMLEIRPKIFLNA